MNVIEFDNRDCSKVRELLDSYLSGELLVETNHKLLSHLDGCEACSRELASKERIQRALRNVVRKEEASDELLQRIRVDLRRSEQKERRSFPVWAFALAAASVLIVVGIGSWRALVPKREGEPALQAAVVSSDEILKIGLDDHVHCAMQRSHASPPPTDEQIERTLGADFSPIAFGVIDRMPGASELVEAHRCTYRDRAFVHMIFRQNGALVSFIVTGKGTLELPGSRDGERGDATEQVYQTTIDGIDVVGFESGRYFAFVVSSLGSYETRSLMDRIDRPVRSSLSSLEA